uniref:Uncharacterized protein n=1 Tax=Ditylenchus dipsaci TaxID=166011 RepID=A0A915E3N0_9BILA
MERNDSKPRAINISQKKNISRLWSDNTMSLLMTETSVVLSNRALVWLKLNKPKNACIDASAALEIEDNLKIAFRRANAFFQLKLYNQAGLILFSVIK